MDLWLRLIYQARDDNPRLPRVCLEIRELKNIAPSKLTDVRYRDSIKTLRQTIFFISTQGGSRRILMLGSTQKLNDVYKPVRSNMATKILLRLGEEEIETLDRSYHFSHEQKRQLSEFNIGMGMILAGGKATWPIELRGAPCGLGLGDQHWLDRYGKAWGARVRQTQFDNWPRKHGDKDWWVHTFDAEVRDTDSPPEIGDYYSEWYLLPEDFEAALGERPDPEEVDQEMVGDVLEHRREYPVPASLAIGESGYEHRQRDIALDTQDEETTVDDLAEEHGIPQACRPWLSMKRPKRKKLVEALEVIREHDDIRARRDLDGRLSYSTSTFGNYMSDNRALKKVVDTGGQGGHYALTPVGEQAAAADWDDVEADLSEDVE